MSDEKMNYTQVNELRNPRYLKDENIENDNDLYEALQHYNTYWQHIYELLTQAQTNQIYLINQISINKTFNKQLKRVMVQISCRSKKIKKANNRLTKYSRSCKKVIGAYIYPAIAVEFINDNRLLVHTDYELSNDVLQLITDNDKLPQSISTIIAKDLKEIKSSNKK